MRLPRWLIGKESACQFRRHRRRGFDYWVRKIPLEEEMGNPLQYSCLWNSMDRGAWWAIAHRVANSWIWLRGWAHIYTQELYLVYCDRSFPGKESASNARDPSSIPGLGRSPWIRDSLTTPVFMGFPGGSDSKESACNVGKLGSIPEWGRSPEGGHGNPF